MNWTLEEINGEYHLKCDGKTSAIYDDEAYAKRILSRFTPDSSNQVVKGVMDNRSRNWKRRGR